MQNRLSIAFLTLFSHALYGGPNIRIGGAERRAFYWMQLLQQEGFPVSAVLAHLKKGSNDLKSQIKAPWPLFEHPKYHINGSVVRAPKPLTGIAGKVRDVFFRLQNRPLPSSTLQNKWLERSVYKQMNAQTYVAFGLTNAANDLARFCSEHQKQCVISIAQDDDFDFLSSDQGKDIYDNKRWLKQTTLDLASMVVVQNSFQMERLVKAGVPASRRILVLNPIEVLPLVPKPRRKKALWVGRVDANKNPLALIRIAEQLPHIQFTVVLDRKTDEPEIKALAPLPANIQVLSAIEPHTMRELYLDSFCLISTSFKEGFPNTFLEAWETGIPVASLHVDPNATLSKQNLGFHANGNMDALAEKIKDWQESPKNAANLGFQGRKYVELHHDSKVIREQLAQLFLSLGQ